MSQPGTLHVMAAQTPSALRDWLSTPARVFSGDPAWIAPLEMVERQRISPEAPIRSFGEVALFVAYRQGRPVGRISAQINRRHLELHGDETGHFGFFDCLDDPEVARGLVDAAAGWLKQRGMRRMAGPFNFSINEECGCLVENFSDPSVVMMPHARPFTGRLLEQAGLVKEMDLYSYRCRPRPLPPPDRLEKLGARLRNARLRTLDFDHYEAEVRLLVDIFNDSWRGNWGFVPFSDAEMRHMAAELKPVLRAEYGRVILLDDEPVGMMVAIPDVNGLVADFAGRLLPFNWAKLAWRLMRKKERGARMLLLGLRQKVHSSPRAGALLALLFADLMRQKSLADLDWIDFSWVLETNHKVNHLARKFAGAPHKVHRLYARQL